LTLVDVAEDLARIELEGAASVLCPSLVEVMANGPSVLRVGASVGAEKSVVANAGPGDADVCGNDGCGSVDFE